MSRNGQSSRSGEIKYLQQKAIKALRKKARDMADLDRAKGKIQGIRAWLVIDILTSSGLRVSECADLCCGDLIDGYGQCALHIRSGKGGKERTVQVPSSLKLHFRSYLEWKKTKAESIEINAPLLVGQRGKMTSQALQLIVKRLLKELGLYRSGLSAHSLRHSYATEYYRRSTGDLRGLQRQLGHSSIQTTSIYSHVSDEQIQENIKGFWGV